MLGQNIPSISPMTYLGVGVDLERVDGDVEGGNFRNVVILALTLLLLQLEGDTTDRAALDALHQVSCEAGNLVPETLRRDNGLGKDMHEDRFPELTIRNIRTTSSMMRLLVWKSRVRRG